MREKPILFSGPMVRAILEGRKTQTRREVKLGNAYHECGRHEIIEWRQQDDKWFGLYEWNTVASLPCPYGQPGDQLWVRETWAGDDGCGVVYRADHPNANIKRGELDDGNQCLSNWKPSIHMPRWASRITLEITGVRVERLWDISHDDAIAEGSNGQGWQVSDDRSPIVYPTHQFRQLWIKINADGSWALNPWVWAITFKRVEA